MIPTAILTRVPVQRPSVTVGFETITGALTGAGFAVVAAEARGASEGLVFMSTDEEGVFSGKETGFCWVGVEVVDCSGGVLSALDVRDPFAGGVEGFS